MTFDQLTKEIVALGFEAEIESGDLLVASTNRALRDLFTRRNILSSVRLFAMGQTPSYYQKEIHHVGGEDQSFPLKGRAYSMRICGMGSFSITNQEGTNITQFDTGQESQLYHGFINYNGTIRFYGGKSFVVYDFSVFDEIFSANASDIPDGSVTKVFDLREMYNDFMSFASPATDRYGNIIRSCRLSDGKLEIPATYKGEINLSYRRLPTTVENNADQVIDVPEEYSHIFPLLVAFYMWLNLDETKSLYYKEQYERMLDLMEKESYQEIDLSYHNTNGWA